MPNRIIKESIRTSRSVSKMTDFQFRLWVYLITYVDDYGRGCADSEIIKGFCFARRQRVSLSDIDNALADLAGMGCIHLYRVDGESYFCFPNWGDHQRIQTKKGKYPGPEEADDDGEMQNSTVSHGESRWVTVDHGELPPESNPIQSNPNPNTNPNPTPRKRGSTSAKQSYGEFGHVKLTAEEHEKLQGYLGFDKYITDLDRYIESTGKRYKSHYATILNWMERDGGKRAAAAGPAPGSLAQEAVRRMMERGETNAGEKTGASGGSAGP